MDEFELPNFGNSNFSVKEFRKFMKQHFDKYSYKINPTNEFKLQSQQKLVPMYANFNNKNPGHGSLLVMHSLGSGKCLKIGTPIMMSDGSIKKVEDIVPGDQVMGDDSTPRNVLSLGRGRDTMYKITPIKGESFTCNSEHILCLKPSNCGYFYKIDKRHKNQKKKWVVDFINPKTITKNARWFATEEEAKAFFEEKSKEDNIIEIPIKDYIKLSKGSKGQLKLYRVPVEFPSREVPLDPYMLGMWLGDGTSTCSKITNQDSTVIKYFKEKLPNYNCYLQYQLERRKHNSYDYRINTTTSKGNYFWRCIKKLGLVNNKHIPDLYKMNSRDIRLGVLAGLIDSDGHYSRNCFEFVQKNERTMDDLIYVARSLGFAAYKSQKKTTWTHKGVKKYGTAWRCTISGDLELIPTKIPRKQATPRKQKKDVLVTGFKVEELPEDNYYGFTLDGNHRFLLGDFTVNHNTCTSIVVGEAYKAFKKMSTDYETRRKKIIYVAPLSVRENVYSNIAGAIEEYKTYGPDGEILDQDYHIAPSKCSEVADEFINSFGVADHLLKEKIRIGEEARMKSLFDERMGIIQQDWLVVTPQKFSNDVFFSRKKGKNFDALTDLGQQLFDGQNLIIIDEVQNLISTSGSTYSKVQTMLNLYGKNNIIVVMSATPIYDKPIELGLTLNLLNPRIYFPSKSFEFNEIFFPRTKNKHGELKGPRVIQNKNLFKWMCTGYVSYFSGGNPLEFPKKRIININHRMTLGQSQAYIRSLIQDINDIKLDFHADDEDEPGFGQLLAKIKGPQRYSNMGLDVTIPKYSGNYTRLFQDYELEDLMNHSSKIKWVIDSILSEIHNETYVEDKNMSPSSGTNFLLSGKVLIFSDFRPYGTDLFAYLLTKYGFKDASKDHTVESEKENRFILWTGSTQKEVRPLVPIFNSLENRNGDYIKIVIGSRAIMEGVDFKAIKTVHIMEPWWNESRIDQVIARSIRFRSHTSFENEKDRFVNVFRHHSVFQSFPHKAEIEELNKSTMLSRITGSDSTSTVKSLGLNRYSIDTYIRSKAENKRNVRREFELLLKESAIDCEQFKSGNNIRLVEHISPLGGSLTLYLIYYENPSTGKMYVRAEENNREISIENLPSYLETCPYPEKGELMEIYTTYDGKEYKKFGNNLGYFIIDNYELGNPNGIINENIDCDQDIVLNLQEKEILQSLQINTTRMNTMRNLLDYIYRDPARLYDYKKDIILGIWKCKNISEETKRTLVVYSATEDSKLLKTIDLDPNARKIYQSLKDSSPAFKRLTEIDNKVDILKSLCIDPTDFRSIPQKYLKIDDPNNPSEIGNIIKMASEIIIEEQFRLGSL